MLRELKQNVAIVTLHLHIHIPKFENHISFSLYSLLHIKTSERKMQGIRYYK